MPTAQQIASEIRGITLYMIGKGLADDYNMPVQRNLGGGLREVSFPNSDRISGDLRGNPYGEVYQDWLRHRVFNLLVPQDGIIQLMYTFDRNGVTSHRLAFYPTIGIENSQSDATTFDLEELFEISTNEIRAPFPVRFDYNSDPLQAVDIRHPHAHLTLGGYENCRIPVTAPLTPGAFVGFVLRNLLTRNDGHSLADGMPVSADPFNDTITVSERSEIHVVVSARNR